MLSVVPGAMDWEKQYPICVYGYRAVYLFLYFEELRKYNTVIPL
jgi:hypothetical protein